MRKRLNETEKKLIVISYNNGDSCETLGVKFGVATGTIYNLVRKAGANRIRRSDSFNERFFQYIDSEEKAYWLGFLYADGNVWQSTIGVSLSECDLPHLNKIKNQLASSAKIRFRESNASWTAKFHSRLMTDDLSKQGLMPCKSRIIKTPKIDEHLMRHFYRGYFDGDGWITYRPSRNVWSIGVVSGSREFIEDVGKWLGGHIGSKAKVVDRKSLNATQIAFEGNRITRKAIELLYVDSKIYLDRKYELAVRVLCTG